ncbi:MULTISPECIES: glycosyl hydrolase family 95 catalytic domain-containing protein [unclassified Amycolatopsis]|uniref:glycosyl hydrolase family 95 catalytic domain-containing protein n=1 Tax=unclassified Amycolatopsis TaxID=2618356 RepID=UPI00287653EC|nr:MULTISPECIES: glycoside hydrolase N-terminal domain-containing protein [unclassified Amycolatopsis]MDS0136749.1 glycoside hydrolase N-terminal domain-containing protein [Amycolatopsis sp. 505]MDS0143414.1 glycoside hydrolase N-terminal domain-containing protein [Amycolatopsis sp. CM201R]
MSNPPSRRTFVKLGGAVGAGLAFSGIPPFLAGADVLRPAAADLVPDARATTLWYPAPAAEDKIIEQGLPIGNGRIGALVGGDPATDFLYLADASLWTGGANDVLEEDGQFPYEREKFGTLGLLAKLRISVPAHTGVTDYRRTLDLSNGLVVITYRHQGVRYRREYFASHPDDVVVIRFSGGPVAGSVSLEPTRGETSSGATAFTGTFANGLKYACTVAGGTTFSGNDVVIVLSGGTNYVPDAARKFLDASLDPLALAKRKAAAALAVGGSALRATHVADYRRLFDRMSVDLGHSPPARRALDTWSRLVARHDQPGVPDPELEASYLQFGRYLTITGSRDGLPMGLQGLWQNTNTPDWMSDYHTDINVQMNYWLADRAALPENFTALAGYCLAQLPVWTDSTNRLFNDPRNRYRNTSGKVAGWAVAFSTNIYGGSGWWWHPGGNAWLCNSLWDHYAHTQDKAYLARIYPLLKGAAEFWDARLLPMTVDGREVLVDDHDWSPEHGPQDARGITYAQEIVWDLFEHYREAVAVLGRDRAYGDRIAGLQKKLYLPKVSPATGWLEEWMSPDNLGETTHRHLSPLIGFFPGDRIAADTAPRELLDGVRALLIARGMDSYGWATAWRSACWARLKDADRAYQLLLTVLRPSVDNGNGTAPNFFDMYSQGSYAIFQIDANLGAPTAMLEMLVYSRPGVLELLPALPSAWAASGRVTGIGARGGFEVDVEWRAGKVTKAVLRSVGGTRTEVRAGTWRRIITLRPGASITVRPSE